ncbi:uncharacterized protein DSM5745_08330 [Aspergillus mulundensis]|uniref:Uncharacterized protein n=1 Tax=Aspergillus mulundensis TaxID=1810919 RepID=A0A3D8R9U6_9EURO|nr:Uncharacterized protein DSM5745_08330 [Aspergillus mulundensis]RDW70819.1 Uncharacterized protein DSM5745_08330 [Aspergillus mulundensis]
MAEEMPTNPPTSFSHDSGFLGEEEEEEDYLRGYLLESPRRWNIKSTLPEQHGSTSPSFIQNRPRTLDRFSEDDDYKRFLFTFPRLYSDLTLERDPFFEGRGMPMNPHNTPISQSGRQSEIGSIGKDKRDVLSPAKSDKHATHQLSEVAAPGDIPLTSLFNGRETAWKPPKPPKPPFLADIGIPAQGETENIQPSLQVVPPKRDEDRRPVPEPPYRSLPSRVTSRNFGQNVEPAVTGKPPEHHPARPKQSWETRSIVPGRYFPRPFTHQELEVLGIPLNNPSMPFPAPIPTIDKLPLRRGIINFDWKLADQYPVGTDGTMETNQPTALQRTLNTLWSISQNIFSPRQLTRTALHYFTPWKLVTSKHNPTVRTTITIPFASRSEMPPVDQDQVSIHGLVDGAYVLQLHFISPLLLVQHRTALAAVLRECMRSRIVMTAVAIVRCLTIIIIRWLLFIFRVEFAVEISQVKEEAVE